MVTADFTPPRTLLSGEHVAGAVDEQVFEHPHDPLYLLPGQASTFVVLPSETKLVKVTHGWRIEQFPIAVAQCLASWLNLSPELQTGYRFGAPGDRYADFDREKYMLEKGGSTVFLGSRFKTSGWKEFQDCVWHLALFPVAPLSKAVAAPNYEPLSNLGEHASLFLHMRTQQTMETQWDFLDYDLRMTVSVTNAEGKVIHQKATQGFQTRAAARAVGFDKFIKLKDLLCKDKNYLHDEALTLVIEVEIVHRTFWISFCPSQTLSSNSPYSEMGDLIHAGQGHDVVVISGRDKYKAHRVFLAARSAYFQKLFESVGLTLTSTVFSIVQLVIRNEDEEFVGDLIRYIYTDQISTRKGVAERLLAVADKHNMENLKLDCENILILALQTDNIEGMLSLAEECHAEKLEAQAVLLQESGSTMTEEGDPLDVLAEFPQEEIQEAVVEMYLLENVDQHDWVSSGAL